MLGAILFIVITKPRKGLQMTQDKKPYKHNNMNLTVKKEDKEYCDKLMKEIQETHGFKVTVTELFSHILLIYKANKPDWVNDPPKAKPRIQS